MRSTTGDYQPTWWLRPRSYSVTLRPINHLLSATGTPRPVFASWSLVRFITVSSALTRRRFGGAGGFPCRVRVPRLARAVRRRARSPARPARVPAARPRTARARAGAAPPRRVQGALRLRVGRPPSAGGRRRETLRCRTAGRRSDTLRTPPADKAPGGRRGSSRREPPDF